MEVSQINITVRSNVAEVAADFERLAAAVKATLDGMDALRSLAALGTPLKNVRNTVVGEMGPEHGLSNGYINEETIRAMMKNIHRNG